MMQYIGEGKKTLGRSVVYKIFSMTRVKFTQHLAGLIFGKNQVHLYHQALCMQRQTANLHRPYTDPESFVKGGPTLQL